jgi:hypothetical protein
VKRDYDAVGWIADYDAVYQRDRVIDFGTYYAIRYMPRPTTSLSNDMAPATPPESR